MSFFLCGIIGLILLLTMPLKVNFNFAFLPIKNSFTLCVKIYGIRLPIIKVILKDKTLHFFFGKNTIQPKIEKIKERASKIKKRIRIKKELLQDIKGKVNLSYVTNENVDKTAIGLSIIQTFVNVFNIPIILNTVPQNNTYLRACGEVNLLTTPLRIINSIKVKK